LSEHFVSIIDPRVDRTKEHRLEDILMIALCAMLCGAESFVDFADFGRAKEDWLRTFLALPHGIPGHDTFGRVFAALDPKAFSECFRNWRRVCVWPWTPKSSPSTARPCGAAMTAPVARSPSTW